MNVLKSPLFNFFTSWWGGKERFGEPSKSFWSGFRPIKQDFEFTPYMEVFEIGKEKTECKSTYFAQELVVDEEGSVDDDPISDEGTWEAIHCTQRNLMEEMDPGTDIRTALGLKTIEGISKWAVLYGTHTDDIVNLVTTGFDIHPLVVEDILNTEEGSKIDVHQRFIVAIMKFADIDDRDRLSIEQVSFIGMRDSKVFLTFQESRRRLFHRKIEFLGDWKDMVLPGYGDIEVDLSLIFSVYLDIVVDSYVHSVEILGDRLHKIESKLLQPSGRRRQLLHEIYAARRDVLYLLTNLWPVRDFLGKILENQSRMTFSKEVLPFFRDVNDHTRRSLDILNIYRELLDGMQNLYTSNVGNHSNDIMRILTVMSTIFLPISTLAGIYGMNFMYMPELTWKYSYFVFWMFVVVACFVYVVLLKITRFI